MINERIVKWKTDSKTDKLRKLSELTEDEVKPIVLVYGKLCSGKGTYCANYPDHVKIVTSDIVRQLRGETKRSGLASTGHMDQAITDELIKQIEQLRDQDKKVVVDGIRQKSIAQLVVDYFRSIGDDVEQVWLDVPKEELKRRYHDRGADKDNQDFETSYDRDEKLGVAELEQWLKRSPNVKTVDHT